MKKKKNLEGLKIGVDARTFNYPGSIARGIGKYSRYFIEEVVKRKKNWNFILFVEYYLSPEIPDPFNQYANVRYELVENYDATQIDIFHVCDPMNFGIGFDSPSRLFPHDKRTVTFYDLIPLHLYYNDWAFIQQKLYIKRLFEYIRSSAIFFSISDYTGKDLRETFNLKRSRIITVNAGLNTNEKKSKKVGNTGFSELKKKYGIKSNYFIHVGAVDPHKNFGTTVGAFIRCSASNKIQLLVVGEKSGSMKDWIKYCSKESKKDKRFSNIIFIGYVSRSNIEVLYRNSIGLVFMSKMEGFGLSVLEAMANSCPVITSNKGSIPEVVEDSAILHDPDSYREISNSMNMLCNDSAYRKKLIEKGLLQSKKFTWAITADKAINYWEGMLENKVSALQRKYVNHKKSRLISVLLDVTVLGLGSRNTVFSSESYHAIENLAHGLSKDEKVSLTFCCHDVDLSMRVNITQACKEYISHHNELLKIPFVSELDKKYDIYHSIFFQLPEHCTVSMRVITISDLMPVVYPELCADIDKKVMHDIIQSIRPGDFIHCTSESTKNDLTRLYDIDENAVAVIPLSGSEDYKPVKDQYRIAFIRNKFKIGQSKYIVSIGGSSPRNNLKTVIAAYAHSTQYVDEVIKLVLIGSERESSLIAAKYILDTECCTDNIIYSGYTTVDDLSMLFSGALAFVYMSNYEGFGLPPLYAMNSGAPVITSNASSLPEVVNGAALTMAPTDQVTLELALNRIYFDSDLRDAMSKRSLKQSTKFTSSVVVQKTVDSYLSIIPNCEPVRARNKIIIDGVFYQLFKTGIARVWQSLLECWVKSNYIEDVLILDRAGTFPRIEGVSCKTIPAFSYDDLQADKDMLQKICDSEHAAVFISTYYTIPTNTPSIFVVYDMIPEILGWNLSLPMWQSKHAAIKNACAYISISENTSRDLVRFFPLIHRENITLAPCGVSLRPPAKPSNMAAKYGIHNPYYLLVGMRGGYKNALLFFQAFSMFKDNRAQYEIVCTGADVILEREFKLLAKPARIHMLNVSDSELSEIYSQAIALVFPSMYEGFGLPIIEAMACGCPVITCPVGPIPEIAADAAIYVQPDSQEEMFSALTTVKTPSLRNRLIMDGKKRAELFRWEESANSISKSIEKFITRPHHDYYEIPLYTDLSKRSKTTNQEQQIRELFLAGENEECVLLIEALLKDNPQNTNGLHYLGLIAISMGLFKDAESYLKLAIEQSPGFKVLSHSLDNLYYAAGINIK